MDTSDPLGLNALLGYAQSVATTFGQPFDANPMHSTVVQGLIAPKPASPTAGSGMTSTSNAPAGDNSMVLVLGGLVLLYMVTK